MKLRAFLSTLPLAAVALALPAKAEPRYVAVVDPMAPVETPPTSSFRSHETDYDYDRAEVTFKTVERSGNGDYMCAKRTVYRICDPLTDAEVARLHHLCERWTCRLGENPLYHS